MRTIVSILIMLCGISTISGQEDITRNGFVQFYYPNEQVSSEGWMQDRQPNGFWATYYSTGIKKSEGKRTNFLLDSLWVFFNNRGD